MKPTVGRILTAASLATALPLGLGASVALAHDDDGDEHARAQFVYAAKVLCPSAGVTTTINVHNPNKATVTFTKEGIALDSGQVPTAPNAQTQQDTLNADWALQMGCSDLASLGAVGPAGFGDVIIQSSGALDVWAVYLTGNAGGGEGGGTILATEVVRVPVTVVPSARRPKSKK